MLQCWIHYVVPPVSLGCRSTSFLPYGVAGSLSFFLFLASGILAHMSRPLSGQVPARSRSHLPERRSIRLSTVREVHCDRLCNRHSASVLLSPHWGAWKLFLPFYYFRQGEVSCHVRVDRFRARLRTHQDLDWWVEYGDFFFDLVRFFDVHGSPTP